MLKSGSVSQPANCRIGSGNKKGSYLNAFRLGNCFVWGQAPRTDHPNWERLGGLISPLGAHCAFAQPPGLIHSTMRLSLPEKSFYKNYSGRRASRIPLCTPWALSASMVIIHPYTILSIAGKSLFYK